MELNCHNVGVFDSADCSNYSVVLRFYCLIDIVAVGRPNIEIWVN